MAALQRRFDGSFGRFIALTAQFFDQLFLIAARIYRGCNLFNFLSGHFFSSWRRRGSCGERPKPRRAACR